MYDTMAAVSPWVWLYFFAIVIVGGFFAVNLALAVLFMQFTANSHKAGEDEEEEEEALSDSFYDEVEATADAKAAAAALAAQSAADAGAADGKGGGKKGDDRGGGKGVDGATPLAQLAYGDLEKGIPGGDGAAAPAASGSFAQRRAGGDDDDLISEPPSELYDEEGNPTPPAWRRAGWPRPAAERLRFCVFWLRVQCLALARSKRYEKLSMALIILNTVDMCLQWCAAAARGAPPPCACARACCRHP